MDELLRIATARRKALLEEVARIDDFLSMATALRSANTVGAAQPLWHELRAARSNTVTTPSEVVAMAEEVLRAVGRPLSRGDLHDRLELAGVRVPGADPVKNLGTIIWRSGRFDNTGRRYWLKDEPRP